MRPRLRAAAHLLAPVARVRWLAARWAQHLIRTRKLTDFQNDFEYFSLQGSRTASRFMLDWTDRRPYLDDKTRTTNFDRHYVYHPAWAARILSQTRPKLHVDIGSTLYFCSIVSAFIPVQFYDYRPPHLVLPALTTSAANLSALEFPDNSIESLSCMHVVEHVGLGRYGDPIDYDGDLKAMQELSRVLASGGHLLFVVPLGGSSRIHYNAHRIYTRNLVADSLRSLELLEFTLIPEDEADGGLVMDPPQALLQRQTYACGCFWFRKPPARH